ncbi:MAG: helix-turn-helix domain-containing protein [Lysinibacillus sp.]
MEFLTVRELSSLINLSEATVYKMLREGVIPGRVKVGKSVRFNKELVMNWLRNGGDTDDSKD